MAYDPRKGGFPSLSSFASGETAGLPDDQWERLGIPKFTQIPQDSGMPAAIKQPDGKRPIWKDVLASVLDTIAIAGGKSDRSDYWGNVMDLQKQVEEERRTNEALAAKAAAIDGLGLPAAQANALKAGLNMSDIRGPAPRIFSDNAGNQWREGENEPFFIDRAQKYNLVSDGNGGVTMVAQPNPYATPKAPVGELRDYDGGGSAPPPARPASQTISQAEFLNLQQRMGKKEAANHIRSRNIQIGN